MSAGVSAGVTGGAFHALRRLAIRLGRDCRGNMALIVAGMVLAVVAVGFGLDYGRAVGLRARMASAGNAAAMAAVSQPMLVGSAADAQGAATSLFVGQVSGLSGLAFDPGSGLSVAVVDGGSAGGRQAVVRWTARYNALFGGLFGASSLPIAGSATAAANGAANVNFTPVQVPASPDLAQAEQGLGSVARNLAAQNGVVYAVQGAPNGGALNGGGPGGYAAALVALNAGLAAPGDGATPTGAQGVVMLLTDGSPGIPGADDLAACVAVKSRGIVLAVLYAPPVGKVAVDGIAAGLQSCASPQLGGAALLVQPAVGQTTAEALAALFALAAGNARLVH